MMGRLEPAAKLVPEMPGLVCERFGDGGAVRRQDFTLRGDGYGNEGVIHDEQRSRQRCGRDIGGVDLIRGAHRLRLRRRGL